MSDEEKDYRVEWAIDVCASDPLEAARQAEQYMLDPGCSTPFFTVIDRDGERYEIDLENP